MNNFQINQLGDVFNLKSIQNAQNTWETAIPFSHCVIDNFLDENLAHTLENEFPLFDSEIWHGYKNAIEDKKVCNNWNVFPENTYSFFSMLNSHEFTEVLSKLLLGGIPLYSDNGLNGGGWHIHSHGGKLNQHLDYSLHPKLRKQRKLNIIIYLNSSWNSSWGGQIGFWSNESSEKPGKLTKEINPEFNRAVIFDTTQNSWHGLTRPLMCPLDQFRKSIAVYYLTDADEDVDRRGKALFAPTPEQEGDEKVLNLIKKRADIKRAGSVYKD